MVDRITDTQFLAAFRANLDDQGPIQVDLNRLGAAEWQLLSDSGIDRAALEAAAGEDGILRGKELEKIWGMVDHLDQNRDGHSFDTEIVTPAGLKQPAPANIVFEVLKSARQAPQRTSVHNFRERFEQGEFDISKLTPDDEAKLAECGMPPALLKRLADDSGAIAGSRSLGSLFYLLDKLDENKDPGSFDRTVPIALDAEPTEEQMQNSGRAERIIEKLFVQYQQPFRTYDDLVRARTVDAENRLPTRSFDVPHVTQWNDTACYKADVEGLNRFQRHLGGKVADAGDCHYMGRAENSRGEITGRKDHFERGLQYIDYCLDNERPVMVGLSHKDAAYSLDLVTDHHVTITGRGYDEDGRVYYTFNDPATSGVHRDGKLYVDAKTSMLFRPPVGRPKGMVYERSYQISRVTPYKDEGFTFKEATGFDPASPSHR